MHAISNTLTLAAIALCAFAFAFIPAARWINSHAAAMAASALAQ